MNDLRKAAEMALEALRNAEVVHMEQLNAMYALQEALAQPDEVLAEREACALIVEHKHVPLNWNDRECFAKAIRARGEK